MPNYNATARTYSGERLVSTSLVEVDASGLVIRAAGTWSHLAGTPAFDEVWRSGRFGDRIELDHDGGAGYMERLAGLGLPPTYFNDGEVA